MFYVRKWSWNPYGNITFLAKKKELNELLSLTWVVSTNKRSAKQVLDIQHE